MRYLFLITFLTLLLGCGETNDDEGQDFGNPFDSPQGLILTQEEHEDGWGRSECFACHPVEEIHRVDREGTEPFPLEGVREIVDEQGLNSCPICHGDNGVE